MRTDQQTRHAKFKPHANELSASLPDGHPALVEDRPLFPGQVFLATQVPRVLVGGESSRKIGRRVTKGAWAGFPVFTLTLPERATCPPCGLKSACYGNGMHYARRVAPGPELVEVLGRELQQHAAEHPGGFAVRLHVLGDFYSRDYLAAWARWMRDIPALHAWGYTAHAASSELGSLIEEMNEYWPGRWVVRFSVNPAPSAIGVREATTIWEPAGAAVVAEGTVCPQAIDKTACCATCGLCWAPEMAEKRIVFVGHGRMNVKGGRPAKPEPKIKAARPLGVPRVSVSNLPDYQRGYNTGYQAGLRHKGRAPRAGA